MQGDHDSLEALALAPLTRGGRRYRLLVGALFAVVVVGLVAYGIQLSRGLEVTGMAETRDRIMWGLYITNFVFFIGISHAGTLISAILRVAKAGWRTPITRMAEFITVVALSVGALMPIVDLGRPDRLLNVFRYGRWQSPVLWDFLAISTYFVGSLLYLYIPLVPDLALVRDRLAGRLSRPRAWLYRTLGLGWVGRPEQKRQLGRALTVMMIVIIPVAVSVHTVVSWIFGMTLRAGWNTAVFGAYFVVGAIFSGIGILIIVMAILRKAFHLEAFVTERHFVNLGYMLAAFGLIMVYFNILELATVGYKLEGQSPQYLGQILTGTFAPLYWLYFLGGLLLPGLVVLLPWSRRVGGVVTAALVVTVSMWIERYIIVVASLRVPQMPYTNLADYLPSGVELAITAGAFALFALIIAVFVRLFPVVSVWEVREQQEAEARAPAPVADRALEGGERIPVEPQVVPG